MTMITPSYLGETIEYSSLHACRSTLEDPTRKQPRNTAFLSRNRVCPKEAFEGLDLCERKLSCTILRGLDGNNPVRLLDHPAKMQGKGLTGEGLHGPMVDPHKAETVFQTRCFVPVVCSQMKTNLW